MKSIKHYFAQVHTKRKAVIASLLLRNLKIVDNLDKMNGSDLNLIKEFFSDKIHSILPDRGQKSFKLKAINKH
ncbi:hypothetical protein SAMN05421741_11636 [Paenimyroides ummariense]|uniref:Uncharacterized protein n=1 Tax=Paenimyroides ummariense TaxID=913024 RepID=A0A1I5DKL6_9FLAO|nr:hypothetical protein SAMN05421741_11636 [Paenimyroides ummariense]